MAYPHRQIEKKWQEFWQKNATFRTEDHSTKPKFYILDMFPYPSGSGLHVGHVTGYTATDILARFMRSKDYNVLHPMGWDSFGLPAEQYAIRTGTHPKITTKKNIDTYRKQLQSLGFSYDWNREVTTSDPQYYKWTQWIFTKLYAKGLAYEAEVQVNFCPALGTVLANEEVENGYSKEGGHPVERRPLRQWILKITQYADRLIEDLETLDWPDSLKRLQINWIGKSSGAKIHFNVENSNTKLSVFTTRPDTLFGVSYLVLAPEHPFVEDLITSQQHVKVKDYQKQVSLKSDLQRTDLAKEKTGVWTGSYALHPVTGEKIPIWIADYVLTSYGTGVVMGVPAHDERDFAFANLFQLPILPVIQPQSSEKIEEVLKGKSPWAEDGILINSDFLNGLSVKEGKKTIQDWLIQNNKGEHSVNYKLRDWLFSRQRYWGEPFPILHLADGTKRILDTDELPLSPPDLQDYKPSPKGDSPLAKAKDWVEIQDVISGQKAQRETNTMPQWAGSCWYYLRFCDPHNEEKAWDEKKERYWLPVDLYVGGVEHAVLHLLYARFWHKVLYDCGYVSTLEPFKKLRNQGLITARSYQLPSGAYISSKEVYEKEGKYYQKETNIELKTQIEKMSKSKLNGITPDEMIEEYGADSLRLYEMFMGPFEQEKLWNTDAVQGCYRFLNRFYALFSSDKICNEVSEIAMQLIHRLVHNIEKDIQNLSFNTAIAKMMEFINDFTPLSKYPKQALKMFTQCLYPFAPHIAEEAWSLLGEQGSLTNVSFPTVNPSYLVQATVLYVVQINGKVRGKWELPHNTNQEKVFNFVQSQEQISKHLVHPIDKVIFVPNKLINIVLKC